MSENRNTEIVETELSDTEVELLNIDEDPRENFRDELFDKLKIALIDEQRLLKRFFDFCAQYDGFEYDEMGMNMEESDAILKRVDKIRDKFLNSIEEKLLYIFDNVDTNTLTRIVSFNLDAKEFQYRVIIEVFEDSFDLEIK